MNNLTSIKKIRLAKLKKLREKGIDLFPSKTHRTHLIAEVLRDFDEIVHSSTTVVIGGRIRSMREHGGSTFFHIEDETGSLQAYIKKDVVEEAPYTQFLNLYDIGDIVETGGTLFTTKMGEKTILVSSVRILAKSLLPLPDKWHGLQDIEERFRKRYLDLLMDEKVRGNFMHRSKIIGEMRNFLAKERFVEVETPVLQNIPGGARAKPFRTRLNALKLDLYLRIAPELYLKQLLIGGFEKIYEIGRCFRNEGMDAVHNPDFTMIELYAAYKDYHWMMNFVEEMLREVVIGVLGKSTISYAGEEIDFGKPFKKLEFADLIKQYTDIDIWSVSNDELRTYLKKQRVHMTKVLHRATMIDELYKEFCKKHLFQPTFVVHHPIELNPLAKANKEDVRKADRCQLITGGIELVNAFSELNDPLEQEERFKEEIKAYPEVAKRIDRDFLEALQYGMPPAAGMGMGIDRLAMLLTNTHSIREVILFPTMRPRHIH